jgi:hypothetical protein
MTTLEIKLHAHRLMVPYLDRLVPIAWDALKRLRFGAHRMLDSSLRRNLAALGDMMYESLCLLLCCAFLRILTELCNDGLAM